MPTQKYLDAAVSHIQDCVYSSLDSPDDSVEDKEFDEVSKLKTFLNSASYDPKEALTLATKLVSYYGEDDLFDYFNATLKSIKNDLGDDVVLSIKGCQTTIRTEWEKLWPENKRESKGNKSEDKETPSLKNRLFTRGKKVAVKTLVRKVSRKMASNTHQLLVTFLSSNPQFKVLLPFVNSEAGMAGVSFLLAMSLEVLPLPQSFIDSIEPIKESLVEELGVMALDKGTEPLEAIAAMLLPALQQGLAPLLAAQNIKKLSY